MCFHSYFWFFFRYSYRNCEFFNRIKICAITAAIKKYNSIITKKKKKHNKIVLLAKSELNSIEVLISKALIDSVISHDESVLINNVLKGLNKMKEEIKNFKT